MNIIIRADASTQIGTGHVMRCLALAQTFQEQGGQAIFVLANESSALESRLFLEGMKVLYLSVEAASNEDAQQTVDFAQQFAAQWLIVDGYHFGADYQKAIKDFGINLLFIDDYGHADHYYANLVLNQNISANQDPYIRREPYTRLLLGLKYTLLRREFWQWRDWSRVIQPIASKILVTLGGSDPDNVTLKVVQALQLLNNDLEVIVVIGGSNPNYAVLQREITDSKVTISLQRNVNNMPELMAWADIAIAAGGSTSWELAFMGLPSIVITLADNQIAIATELAARNLIVHLGWHQQITLEQIGLAVEELIDKPNQRKEMSKSGRELVDGNGANLVASQMLNMLA
jgi:UDP-2,4-diacetamido-2,4,6-trideoxy-beta-L-altropyranose hydrolase